MKMPIEGLSCERLEKELNKDPQRKYGAPRDNGARKHQGLDICGIKGQKIYTIKRGKVSHISSFYRNTYYIEIDLGGGWFHGYGEVMPPPHIFVKVGDIVEAGVVIGRMGKPLTSRPPMLHFEIWYSGFSQDPIELLRKCEARK